MVWEGKMRIARTRSRGLSVPSNWGAPTGATLLGVLIGLIARGHDATGGIFALLVLSAGVVGLAQQTLP